MVKSKVCSIWTNRMILMIYRILILLLIMLNFGFTPMIYEIPLTLKIIIACVIYLFHFDQIERMMRKDRNIDKRTVSDKLVTSILLSTFISIFIMFCSMNVSISKTSIFL